MSKKQSYVVWGLVVVAIVALAIYSYKHKSAPSSTSTENQESVVSTSTTPAAGKKLPYGDAIKAYPYRFQFSQCHGNPGTISVRKGSPVMLDNRDKVSHTIKANGQSFRIAGYDYAVVYPQQITKDSQDPTLSNVTCDGGGAAVLNVEK